MARNIVATHSEKIAALIAAGGKDGKLSTPEAVDEFDRTMDIDASEHFAYQQAQAHAHAAGVLNADEAMIVYRALGEVQSSKNGGWQPGVSLALKVTITTLMGELMLQGVR